MTSAGSRVAGRYLLRSRLGGGAMGAVWLARDELLGRDVAVKQVLIPVGSDPETTAGHREAAMREGRIAARLSHPHAVSVYDMVDDGGTPWLVMEYLPSRSLATVLAESRTLPVEQVAQIGAQLADALVATHAAGVVHRDVKPGNVLIGEGPRSDGLVKITDFGISRALGDVSLTQTGVVKGTPAFLAPEVARGQEPNEASDVFSLGATLYAALEGSPPFGMTENPLEMLYRVAGGDFQRPRHAGALTRPLMRMLDPDPTRRPSMAAVRDELATLAAGRDRDVTEVLTARTPLPATLTDVRPVASGERPSVPAAASATAAETDHPVRTAVGPMPARGDDAPPPAEPTAPAGAVPPPSTPKVDRPAAPPVDRPAAPPVDRPARRRRGRLIALAALLVAALVVAAVLIWRNGQADPDESGSATAPTSSAAPSPSETPTPTTESSPAPTTEASPAPTTETTPESSPPPSSSAPAGPAEGSAAEVQQAITSYYALLPQDPATAWERTTGRLRQAESRSNYIRFWNRFSDVQIGAVQATDGSLTATVPVTFVENGSTSPETHQITLVRGDGGQLLVDYDVPV